MKYSTDATHRPNEGVVAEGYVQYTFTLGTPTTGGECTIHVYGM